MVEKEIHPVEKPQEFRTGDPIQESKVNTVGNQPVVIPSSADIFLAGSKVVTEQGAFLRRVVPLFNDLVEEARNRDCLNVLTEKQRMAIGLFHPEAGERMSIGQAREKMQGISKSAVHKHKNKAYKKLGKAMNIEVLEGFKKTAAMRQLERVRGYSIEEILEGYVSQGLEKKEISRILERDYKTLLDWLDRLHIPEVDVPKKTSKILELEDQFKEPISSILQRLYYDEKKSEAETAKDLGLKDARTVSRWLKSFGMTPRTKEEGRKLALEDPVKRQRWFNKSIRHKKKLSESMAAYHRDKRKTLQKQPIARNYT